MLKKIKLVIEIYYEVWLNVTRSFFFIYWNGKGKKITIIQSIEHNLLIEVHKIITIGIVLRTVISNIIQSPDFALRNTMKNMFSDIGDILFQQNFN